MLFFAKRTAARRLSIVTLHGSTINRLSQLLDRAPSELCHSSTGSSYSPLKIVVRAIIVTVGYISGRPFVFQGRHGGHWKVRYTPVEFIGKPLPQGAGRRTPKPKCSQAS